MCALVCAQTPSLSPTVLRLATEFASLDEGNTPDGDALENLRTARCITFHHLAKRAVNAPKGLAHRVLFYSGYLAYLALQAVLSAHVAFAPRARLRKSFLRTLRSQKKLLINVSNT